MRIAIIGAGWFGCHIGKRLLDDDHDVTIFEQEESIFKRASGFNSGRLHLGFHYPRSKSTRKQSQEGYERFRSVYGDFCEQVGPNLYLIAKSGSLIDFDSFKAIMHSDKIPFEEVPPESFGFIDVEGAILTEEMAINQHKAIAYFEQALTSVLKLSTRAIINESNRGSMTVNDEDFDVCIDCSYLSEPSTNVAADVCFENIITPLFKPLKSFEEKSFVVMDGDFFSLNPFYTNKNDYLYSLYHVTSSVVWVSNNYKEAAEKEVLLKIGNWQEQIDIENLVRSVQSIYPAFSEEFELEGCFYSIRTKRINANANRECSVARDGRKITVVSGKINSVFDADAKVLSVLELM